MGPVVEHEQANRLLCVGRYDTMHARLDQGSTIFPEFTAVPCDEGGAVEIDRGADHPG